MNINKVTIGQLKELKELVGLFGSSEPSKKPDMLAHLIGEKVVIRDHLAGVIVTTLKDVNGSEWLGGKSRKVHFWRKAGAVEGISKTGIDLGGSRIAVHTPQSNGKNLIQICICEDAVYDSIMGVDAWNPK